MKDIYKILVITSTFPKNEVDPVPTFVKEQIISLKSKYPFINFHVLAPSTKGKIPYTEYVNYNETRFRYFINKFEILNTYGLISSIKRNKFLIFLLPLYLISLIYNSIKVCLKFKPDLVYVHWVTPQAIIALLLKKLFRVNYVFSTHSNDALILTKFIGGTALLNSVVKNSHAFISDSKAIESNLKKHIKEKNWDLCKSNILTMGVNSNKFKNQDEDLSDRLSNLNDKIIISFIGRFVEKKGVENLIKIFYRILKKYPGCHLLICGQGPLVSDYKYLINNYKIGDSVSILNFFNDDKKLTSVYKFTDIIIVPSIQTEKGETEGVPVSLLESLHNGKLVVASVQSNAKDVIENDKNGLLFDYLKKNDFENVFKKAIELQVEPKLKKIKEEALLKGSIFNWDKISEDYFKILYRNNS
jgi:glycosyltransferase involved in cell wall biosynthesis